MFEEDKVGNVIVQAHFLLIKEFEDVVKTYKANGIKVLGYVYFLTDFKSPYKKSFPEAEIPKIVQKDLKIEDIKLDSNVIKAAIAKYKELQNVKSLKMFEAADKAVEQLIQYFNNFDEATLNPERKDDIVNKVMKNLSSVGELTLTLNKARKSVEEDIMAKNIRGQQTIKKRELPKNQR